MDQIHNRIGDVLENAVILLELFVVRRTSVGIMFDKLASVFSRVCGNLKFCSEKKDSNRAPIRAPIGQHNLCDFWFFPNILKYVLGFLGFILFQNG